MWYFYVILILVIIFELMYAIGLTKAIIKEWRWYREKKELLQKGILLNQFKYSNGSIKYYIFFWGFVIIGISFMPAFFRQQHVIPVEENMSWLILGTIIFMIYGGDVKCNEDRVLKLSRAILDTVCSALSILLLFWGTIRCAFMIATEIR